LQHIESAIASIHQEVGTVVKVSRLYETPSWGFESEAFYNCALVMHTQRSAHEVLEKVLWVEQKLGRIRSENQGYQPRVIDIDVIAFDEAIILSDELQVPHPAMQERMFVLVPMRDLNPTETPNLAEIFTRTAARLRRQKQLQSNPETRCAAGQNALRAVQLHRHRRQYWRR
jgi:2-amino-4-hydroxy-6-hydroxymethyldihydropteridine diphosphokinase